MRNYNRNIFATISASNHTDTVRQGQDYYATDPVAIDKLLKVTKPYHVIWECACGGGHLTKRLQQYGYIVYSSDIVDRGCIGFQRIDFLQTQKTINDIVDFDIITNPPYVLAKDFVLKALSLLSPGRKAYMFLKLTFLEGKQRYCEIYKKYPPKCVYVFSERVICAKDGKFEEYTSSAVAYAWFEWEKGYKGETTIKWI